jgi:DNA-binding NarL/FixJ family response regulator
MDGFRILVADDHPVFRFGLCSLIRSHKGWEVCGEATDGRDAVVKYRELKPNLVILDISLPKLNGLDAARQILKLDPAQRILVVTDVDSEHVILDCVEAGVRGWVFKSEPTEDLTTAVEALERHKSIFSSRVSDLIADSNKELRTRLPVIKVPKLSPREREIVTLIGEGKTSKDIALTLNVAIKTAETHRTNILRKLNLHSTVELVLYAVRNELVHVHRPSSLGFPQPSNGRADIASQGLN